MQDLDAGTPAISHEAIDGTSSALVRKLGRMVLLSTAEVTFLEGLQANRAKFEKGRELVADGAEYPATFIVRRGWVARQKILEDGRRQILSFALPGDFLGLHVNFRRVAAYDAVALTDTEVALLDPNRVLEIYRDYPILASGLSWATVREFNVLGEQAVRLGRRSAAERMCHLLLELWYRLDLVDEAGERSLEFPLTQRDASDTLGLSQVHVNRTFRYLKEAGIIDYSRGTVAIRSFDKLKAIAAFEPEYLAPFQLRK